MRGRPTAFCNITHVCRSLVRKRITATQLFFTPPLGHPVRQRCSLLKRPVRWQPDPLRCHHAGGCRVRVSLTYTKSVLFPYPLSSCSYRLYLHYTIYCLFLYFACNSIFLRLCKKMTATHALSRDTHLRS